MTYTLRDLRIGDPADAGKLAALFNAFDSAWPGGFSRGLDFTPEQLDDYIRNLSRLAILVAEHRGEFVGFCDLEAQPGHKEAAYIPLLGARLEHHGKGVGKMLLREMVGRVTQLGFHQVTLYTWSGNTKAVPLYKKTGFQWVPETEVFMRNFMPAVLRSQHGVEFFAQRDWYATMQRDPVIAPDDDRLHGMKVYHYRFTDGPEFLEMSFDAAGFGLCAVETPRFSAMCIAPAEEAPAGEETPISWIVKWNGASPAEAALLVEAEDGLDIRLQEQFTVCGERRIDRTVRTLPGAAPRPRNVPERRVKSMLLLNGEPILLQTGIRVVRPVQMWVSGPPLSAGRPEPLRVVMHNRLDRDVLGAITLDAVPALQQETSAPVHVRLPARLMSECELKVTAGRAGAYETRLRLQADNASVERPIWLRALDGSAAVGSVDSSYDETAVLDAFGMRAEIDLRGSDFRLVHPASGRTYISQAQADVGPPYVEEPLTDPLLAGKVDRRAEGDRIVTSLDIVDRPGLRVERTVSFAGPNLARIEHRVYNSSDTAHETGIRIRTWPGLQGAVAVFAPAGLIRQDFSAGEDFPSGDTDLLPFGAATREPWIASEEDGMVCGLIWTGEPEGRTLWSVFPSLRYSLGTVPAHGLAEAPPVYLYAGPGDWTTVRNAWRRLARLDAQPEADLPEPHGVLEVVTRPSPALLTGAGEEITVEVISRRGAPRDGMLHLQSACLRPPQVDLPFTGISRDNLAEATVRAETPSLGAFSLDARFEGSGAVHRFHLPVIRLASSGEVRVEPESHGQISVDNGWMRFTVAPGFLGCMVALERDGVNHLCSAYPEARAFLWTGSWYGGVHPVLGNLWDVANLAAEAFTGGRTERTGETGLVWHGAQVSCSPQHKDRRWLELKVEYLTLPGSNCVAILTRWKNKNRCRHHHAARIGVWPQAGGDRSQAVAHWKFGGERRERRRGGFPVSAGAGDWAAVERAGGGGCLQLIAPSPRGHVELSDHGMEGAFLQGDVRLDLPAEETGEALFWLVLTPDASQAEEYAALGRVRRLP